MFNRIASGRGFGRGLVFAGMMAGTTLAGLSACAAGECPGGKNKADVRAPVGHAGKGVTDTVLAAIDLEKEPANIKERQLRFRKLTIEPRRYRALAQPRRPACDHLYRRGRDRRIRQQLR
jgi:hypothetical protein